MSETTHTQIGGKYEVLETLGKGGMGQVFKARDKSLRRIVALKVISPHLLADDEARTRFEREARSGAQLEHDHIVTTYDYGFYNDQPYLAVAYIEGETLAERIRRQGRLSPEETVRLIAPIAEALAHAHSEGVIHRDVKSSNIMIRAKDERPILIDFGIARASFTHTLTRRGDSPGTPQYMSPEQAAAQEIDHRSDLYSLGVVLYKCLTGTVPFQSTHIEVLLHNIEKKPHRPVRERVPEVPLWLADVVDRCLAKEPEDRFPDGETLAKALRVGLASKAEDETIEIETTAAETETTVLDIETAPTETETAAPEEPQPVKTSPIPKWKSSAAQKMFPPVPKTKKRRPKAPSRKKSASPRKKVTAALVSSQRKKEILGGILMTLALLLSLAFVTYDPADNDIARDFSPGALFAPGGNKAGNALSLIGAVLAFWVVPNFLGYASLLLTGLLFAWGYVIFRHRKTVYLPFVSMLTVAGAVVLATLLGWIGIAMEQDWSVWSGAVGQGLAGWMRQVFGALGSFVLLTLLIIATLLLLIDRDIQRSIDRFRDGFQRILFWFKD